MDYDNTNTGAMFVNDRKTTDRHPDRSGNAEIKCPHCDQVSPYWVSGWIKTAKRSGQKFLSLAFSPKDDNGNQAASAPAFEDDGDIPF